MKQITMDFDIYQAELRSAKKEGYLEAVNNAKYIWFEMDEKKGFCDFYDKYNLDAYEYLPLRELILFINNRFGFKP
jgi:hypothetical protein